MIAIDTIKSYNYKYSILKFPGNTCTDCNKIYLDEHLGNPYKHRSHVRYIDLCADCRRREMYREYSKIRGTYILTKSRNCW